MVKIKKKPYLEDHFVLGIKVLLERRRKEIEKQIEELKNQDPFFVEGRLSENEWVEDAAEQEGHGRVEALVRQLKATLSQIKKALARIAEGKYGICEKCGKVIDKARLKAMPMTTLCSECAARA